MLGVSDDHESLITCELPCHLESGRPFFTIIIINRSRENHHRDTCIVKPIITGHAVFFDKKLNRTEIVTFKRDDDDKITTSTNRSSSVDH